MPPEPSPWDRKDFLRERKYEGAAATATGKWKDSYQKSGDLTPLRLSRSDDAPRVSGFSKQGSYRLFPEESSYGTAPRPATDPRSHERMIEDENCRPSSSHRLDGKTGRSSRDDKGVGTPSSKSGQREWKGYQSDSGDGYFPSSTGRHEESVRYMSHHYQSHSGSESSWDRHHFEKQGDKMGIDGFHGRYSERSMDVRIDRLTGSQGDYSHESSLGSIRWKPLKWARPSSVSSWGSVISQSPGSKSCRREDGNGAGMSRKSTPSRSLSGDASGDSSHARKKQRLGWGQGLAKYEKEKVEGHEDTCTKSDPALQSADLKRMDSPLLSLQDESPIVAARQGCVSPTTSSLAACSLPPGEQDKDSLKIASYVGEVLFDGRTGGVAEEFVRNLDNLDINEIYSLISDLVQSEDSFSDHPTSMGSASLDKLASLKKGIMKLLEKKEHEIDMSENELRSLCSETNKMDTCHSANSSDGVTHGCSKNLNESDEESLGLNPSCDSILSQPSVLVQTSSRSAEHMLCDVQCLQSDELVRACQSCGPQPSILSSSMDIGLVKCATDERTSAEPSIGMQSSISGDACKNGNWANQDVINCSTYACTYLKSTLITSVFAVNEKLAREASDELVRFLPAEALRSKSISADALDSVRHENSSGSIRGNLARRKCYLRFKERALTLKYRAFYHLWKEDLRLLSIRKYRSKQQKRLEPSCRSFQNGFQKHRTSIRSRFTSPAGNLTLVPTTEVVAFTGKLLSDSQMKVCRNNLKMPALILDEKERHSLRFLSWNGLVEDPRAVEKERVMINPWTTEEREIFMESLTAFGKDFSKIASFLKHKTTADCVEFYYKNHKSENFDKVRKLMGKTKQAKGALANTYLVTTGKKWNHEANAVSLDILGAASVAAAHTYGNQHVRLKYVEGLPMDSYYDCKMSEMDDGVLERIGDPDMLGNERDVRAVAADLMVGNCGAMSSEAVSSCVTSSIGPVDGSYDWKYQKMDSGLDTPLTPELMQNIDEDTCSDESYEEVAFSDWTDAEKAIFITALRSYGKDFATISRCVGSRSRDQCKIFFSKARKCLGLDVIHVGLGNEGTPLSDARGGRSDTEDACAGEMDSAFCTTQSCSKVEMDGSPVGFGGSMISSSNEGYGYSGNNSLQVKECIVAETEQRITQFSKETQIKNEDDHPAVLQIQESAVDQCDVAGKEKLDVIDPKVEQDVVGSTINVAGQDKGKVPGVKVEVEPDIEMHDDPLGDSCRYCEGVIHHNTDIGAEAKENDAVDSDAHGSGLLGASVEQSMSESVMLGCSSKQLGSLSSDQQGSHAAMVISSAKDKDSAAAMVIPGDGDHDITLSRRIEIDDSTYSHREQSLPAPSYNPCVTDGPLSPSPEVLVCGKKPQLISWRQGNCPTAVMNSTQEIGKANLKDESPTGHYDGNILQVAQLPRSSQEIGNKEVVQEPEKVMCGFTKSDFYRQHGTGCQSSHKVDLPLQNFAGYSMQTLNKEDDDGGGSVSSVGELRGFASVKKWNDSLRNLTLQNQFFIQENGSGRHSNSHIEYSLFLPKSLDNLDGAAEKMSSEGASPFDASRGLKQEISKKCSALLEKEGESPKPGEVKLFGQNLVVHPSANNKPVPTQTDSRAPAVQKVYPLQERNGNTAGLNMTEHKGSDEIPRCTYGFWDGNRIQTGLSAMPDSGLLISSSSRVNDCRGASCHSMEQRTVSAAKVDDRMFYASRETIGTSGLTNFHIYSNEAVQPFTVEVNRPIAVVSDVQKRSIMLEKMQPPLLGLQHQARSVSGVNVVNCLSDPVVALKMHYAETLCMQNGVREEDSWRGDINR